MTEQVNAGDGNQNNNNQNNSGDQGSANSQNGNQSAQNNQNTSTTTFDPSKISDEEFVKVFEDQRLFQHSRFKELTESQRRLKEYEANEQKRKEEELQKQGKHKELAEQKEKEAQSLREELKNTRIDNKLLAAAQKLNAVDPEAVLKLVDRSKVTLNDDGSITGIDEALKALSESKAYLFGKQTTTNLGSPSNPGNQNNTGDLKRFKHSEITNPEFFRANEKDILASMAAGLIENDL